MSAPDSTEVSGRATTGGGLRALLPVAVLLAAVASVIGGLALLSRPGADPDRSSSPDEPTPTLPGFFTTTASTGTSSPASSSASGPSQTSATTMVPGAFPLGEPTGLWLFHGGTDVLQRLDLDTGEVVDFGIEAFPLLATGDDIVIYQGQSKVVGWVSAADPGEQALNWKRGPVAPGIEEGSLWILDRDREAEHPSGETVGTGRWDLFDTEANRAIERRPGDLYPDLADDLLEARALGGRFEVLHPGPDFTVRADGVYRYSDLGYQRIGPGRVLTYDGSRLLLADCPATGDCAYNWFDRDSGLPASRAVPSGRVVFAEMLGDGRWLHAVDEAGRSELLDYTTGNRLQFEPPLRFTISPDGRWIAYRDGDRVTVADLVQGFAPSFEYRNVSVDEDGLGDLLFVERR